MPVSLICWTRRPTVRRLARVLQVAATLGGLAGLGACHDSTTARSVALGHVSILPADARVTTGGRLTLTAQVYDPAGALVERSDLITQWTSATPEVATVSTVGEVQGVANGSSIIAVTVRTLAGDSITGRTSISVLPPTVASLTIAPDRATMRTSDTLQFHAVAIDSTGRPIGQPTITWATTSRAIAMADPAGLVTAYTPGLTTLTATSGTRTATATITVVPAVVATLRIVPPDRTLIPGDRVHLATVAQDAQGHVVPGTPTWASSNAPVATVDATGLVRAYAVGTTTLTASQGGQWATWTLTVTPGTGMAIRGVAPTGGALGDAVRAGTSVTVYGTALGSATGHPTVTVDGQPATVVSVAADGTTLTLLLPPPASDPLCQPTRAVPIVVTRTDGQIAQVAEGTVPLAVATQVVLAPGQALFAGASIGLQCLEIPSQGGNYAIALTNPADTSGLVGGVTLRGVPGATATDARLAQSAIPPRGASPVVGPTRTAARALPTDQATPRTRIHDQVLTAADQVIRRLGRPAGLSGRGRGARAMVAALAAPPVGSLVVLRVPTLSNLCLYTPIQARVQAVTAHTLVLEDTAAAGSGRRQATYQALADEFEHTMWPILQRNFGDPLRLDGQLNGQGYLTMVFTPRVTQMGGASLNGFVSSGDFYAPTACGASNHTEVFYAATPTDTTAVTTRQWSASTRPTIIHEVKHMVQYAARFATNAPTETRWIEEGSAFLAEEIYDRTFNGSTQRSAATYQRSLACETTVLAPSCAGWARSMYDHFAYLYQFLQQPTNRSPLGSASGTDYSYYGSAWALLRYAADQSGQDEAAFFTALTQTSRTGLANLTAVSGLDAPTLLSGYLLALTMEGAGAPPTMATLRFPSWGLHDAFYGFEGAVHGTSQAPLFPTVFPYTAPALTYGTFEQKYPSLPGGSGMVVTLDGATQTTQVLQVLPISAGGAVRPIAVTIWRLR